MKIHAPKIAVSMLALTSISVLPTAAAPKKLPVKAAAKPAARQHKLIREVLGTQQLQGWEGDLNETFTIGKNTQFNFTLKKVEYSVNRVNIGGNAHFAKGDEKMLIVRYTIQNPLKRPFTYSANYLIFKAVDANGLSRDYVGNVAREVTGEALNVPLNPGQKVEAYTAIPVAAFGEVPKLIVQSWYEREAPIVRYDLRGKVQPLAAPFADPSDAKGATARKIVPVKMNTFYPVTDNFDAKLDSISYQTEPLMGRAPGKGNRLCVAIFTLQNKGLKPNKFSGAYFRADLKDADGEKVDYNSLMLKATRDEYAGTDLQPGEEARVRFFFELPEKVDAKSILLQYGYDRESRIYAFDVAK